MAPALRSCGTGEPLPGHAHFGFLQILDAEDLALPFRIGAGRKVFAAAPAVDAGVNLKNDLPPKIRELRDEVWLFLLRGRFARSTTNSAVGISSQKRKLAERVSNRRELTTQPVPRPSFCFITNELEQT
jgi:hypothetical protein